MFTAKMAVTEAKMNDNFTVQAYYKTFGGQVVTGEERVVCVAKDTSNASLNIKVDGELDKNATYTAAFTSKVNSEVTSVTETAAAVEVLSVGEGYSNVRITLTGSNKVSDMASVTKVTFSGTEATGVYRNYYTSYLSGTNAGKPDTSWYDVYADGKEFVIATNADLYGFATINENFDGDSVYLVSDVKANEGTAKADGFTGTTTYEWEPIGWAATDQGVIVRNFAGTFDGQGHVISGVFLAKTGTANGSWGLFGETGACTIKNFTLENSYFGFTSITNTLNIGTVAGKSKGIIDTVKVADTVYVNAYGSQEEHTGGIVGYMSGTAENYGKITNCWFDGTITGHDYIGGIVGFVQDGTNTTASTLHKKEVEISHCLSSGTISLNKNSPILGGICSYINYGQAIIEDCVNVSNIVLNDYTLNVTLTGSVVGWVTANPYDEDATAAATSKRYSLVLDNTYGTSDGNWKCSLFSNPKGHHYINGVEYLGSKTQRVSFGSVASFTGETGYLNMKLDFTIADSYDGYWTATTSTPILSSFAEELINSSKLALDEVTSARTVWYEANDTSYTLYTKADMYGFASLTDVTFAGKTVKLGADIALNKGTAAETGFTPASGATLVEWTPRAMEGTLDGAGHTLSGVYLDTNVGNAGLFTSVTGTVKDLRLRNSYFNCTDATAQHYEDTDFLYGVGSIAGSLSGTLDTVYSDAIVNHTNAYAGGLVGTVYDSSGNGTKTTTITNCAYAGKIKARNGVGGIVGLLVNTKAEMKHCLNMGQVTATDLIAGGLCGYMWTSTGSTVTCELTLEDSLNVGRAVFEAGNTWSGGCIGRMRNANANVQTSYYILNYADTTKPWGRFTYTTGTSVLNLIDKTSASINQNTYNPMTEQSVLNHNVTLSFLPEGQESSSTDAYYWVARTGKVPMLESFEDLLTDVTY